MRISDLTDDHVMKSYRGQANKCACGCKGTYKANPKHRALADKDRGYAHSDDELSSRSIHFALLAIKEGSARAEISNTNGHFVTNVFVTNGDRWVGIYLVPGVTVDANEVLPNMNEQ